MRLLAYIVLLIALASAGWAAQQFWDEWTVEREPQVRRSATQTGEAQPPERQVVSRQWPAVFGEPQPPAPPEPQPPKQEEEPQPPPQAMPPLDSMGYKLTGVIEMNDGVWAMISHPSGEQILRQGDELTEGLVVTRISKTGLWAAPDGGEEMMLGFPE
ncbi:type II secretion system protein N [Roseovarius sp.]|jgi:hypothetical protein|uniref:type II secretion system protein N n=1 Tax=Roseovarius sp. TaxID=1486281 RepID=UPI00261583B9|nr:type II secretion system protein N [Roseovarius sp.]MDM8167628.1 type II secretion system protein N [Roseovarius sp.]